MVLKSTGNYIFQLKFADNLQKDRLKSYIKFIKN